LVGPSLDSSSGFADGFAADFKKPFIPLRPIVSDLRLPAAQHLCRGNLGVQCTGFNVRRMTVQTKHMRTAVFLAHFSNTQGTRSTGLHVTLYVKTSWCTVCQ
jgi:hypothetical protein